MGNSCKTVKRFWQRFPHEITLAQEAPQNPKRKPANIRTHLENICSSYRLERKKPGDHKSKMDFEIVKAHFDEPVTLQTCHHQYQVSGIAIHDDESICLGILNSVSVSVNDHVIVLGGLILIDQHGQPAGGYLSQQQSINFAGLDILCDNGSFVLFNEPRNLVVHLENQENGFWITPRNRLMRVRKIIRDPHSSERFAYQMFGETEFRFHTLEK